MTRRSSLERSVATPLPRTRRKAPHHLDLSPQPASPKPAAPIVPDAEREFMQAMHDYKQASGRMFPTWSEVLEVLKALGYAKQA